MSSELQNWKEQQFMPWKKAMESQKNEQQALVNKIKQNSNALKHIVSLMIDGRLSEAVEIWNTVGIQPMLSNLELDMKMDTVTLTSVDNQKQKLQLTVLLHELQSILKS